MKTQGMGLHIKVIRDNKIPVRVCYILWEINRQAILTKSRLHKIFPDAETLYILCGNAEETINHLLLNCEHTNRVWKAFADGYGVHL